jgi:hypothetical protein
VVNYDMTTNLIGKYRVCDGVNEFIKSGLTQVPSDLVNLSE